MPADPLEQPAIRHSLEDLIEACRRLRQKAKENPGEADRIMEYPQKLESVIREQTGCHPKSN